jgi:hypothetical protein
VHELRSTDSPGGDPDKTNPPTRVEDLWGVDPGVIADSRPSRPVPETPASGNGDAFTLYRAARDCMMAGAYTGATALLRRLILQIAVEQGNEAGTRDEAERLLAVAESLLGRQDDRDRPSNA